MNKENAEKIKSKPISYNKFADQKETVKEIVKESVKEPVKESVKKPVEKYAKVIVGKLNVRKDPSKTSEVLTIVNRDTNLKIISNEKTWAKIVTPYGIEGFVMLEFLNFV